MLTPEEKINYREKFCPLDQKFTRYSRIADQSGTTMAHWHWKCDDCFYRARKPESLLNDFDRACMEREALLAQMPLVQDFTVLSRRDDVGVTTATLWAVYETLNGIPVVPVTRHFPRKTQALTMLRTYKKQFGIA